MDTPTLTISIIFVLAFIVMDIFFALSLKNKFSEQNKTNKVLRDELQKLQLQIDKNILEDKIRDEETKRMAEIQKELLTHNKMTDILLTKIQAETKGRS